MKELSAEKLNAYLEEYDRPIMDKLNCKITWGIINEPASEAANHYITASEKCPLSRILTEAEVTDKTAYQNEDTLNNQVYRELNRLATFEPNFWKLDGNYLLPERDGNGVVINRGEIGWVSSALCNTSGAFSSENYPSLNIKFEGDQDVSLVGLHFIFFAYCGEYSTKFDVLVKASPNGTIEEFTISDAAADQYSYDLDFSQCTIKNAAEEVVTTFTNGITHIQEITVVIKEWSKPSRRARIDEIEFGVYKIYDNNTLIDAEETRVMNAVSTELPISNFVFTVLDSQMLFDSENPGKLTQFLTTRQPVAVEWIQQTETGDVTVKSGTYYLKEWNDCDSRREYKLTAEDLIGFMEEPYYKGIFTGEEKGVKELVEDLFKDLFPQSSGLSDKLDCSAISEDIKITAPLPLKLNNQQCTYKDCFMMLAQIAGCVITTDAEGRIVFKKLSRNYVTDGTETPPQQYKIPTSVVFDNPPRSNLKSALKQVQVNCYEYKFDDNISNDLYNGKITIKKGEKYTFELSGGGQSKTLTLNESIIINFPQETIFESQNFSIRSYTYMVELVYNGSDPAIVDKELNIVIKGKKLVPFISVYSSKIENVNGEVVTVDVPICSNYTQAEKIAANFIAETEERDEFELEIKRNVLLECGDVLELEKPIFGSEQYSKIPCRLWENKKSLTKVRQNVKLRKLNLT